MTLNLSTLIDDLQALTTEDLTRVQLAVNGEYSARVQDERLARRISRSLAAAQSAGLTDAQVDEKIAEGKEKARRPVDPDDVTVGKPRSNPQADLRAKTREFVESVINKKGSQP